MNRNPEDTWLFRWVIFTAALFCVIFFMQWRNEEAKHAAQVHAIKDCAAPDGHSKLIWTLNKSADGKMGESFCHYEDRLAYGEALR